MNIDTQFGNYLKAADIEAAGGSAALIIESVEAEQVGDERKIVIGFVGTAKGLVLNVTNKERLKLVLGTTETEQWIGRPITLVVEMAEFKGQPCKAVRVRVDTPGAQQVPAGNLNAGLPGAQVAPLTESDHPF